MTVEITRATDEFVAWLLATRADWTERDVTAAIAGATTLNYGWAQIALGLAGLAFEGTGRPRDLTPVHTPSQQPQPGPGLPASEEAKTEVAATRERLASISARRNTDPETAWPMGRLDG